MVEAGGWGLGKVFPEGFGGWGFARGLAVWTYGFC